MATKERLKDDLRSMKELKKHCSHFNYKILENVDAPSKYEISFQCCSYIYSEEKRDVICTGPDYEHKAEIFLGRTYPVVPPRIEWKTSIYHPNIMAGSQACILGGLWDPERSLADVCRQLFEMVQYKNYDPYNWLPAAKEAAEWARSQPAGTFPADTSPI